MLIERLASAVAATALALVMLVGVTDIVAGEILGVFLAFKVDMSGTLTAAAIFLAWPLVQSRNEHINVDLFAGIFPRWSIIPREIIAKLAGFIFFALIARGTWKVALDSLAIREKSAATLGYPIWPAKLACAIGASLVLLVITLQIGRLIHEMWRGRNRHI
ncbi:MAG: TRAP transporter small permease [Paracoccaceae bacterium]|nr:TRAP transporter small permease [Paracoccaceae bacterium]